MPLADSLLTKPGIFPEQRPCGEDFRKKWIEVSKPFDFRQVENLFLFLFLTFPVEGLTIF